ncbi:MAG: glycosyltransferase, partial [Ferruginibacter sp.]|nr:glycosyltransferase [Ferruginibacter sp.]
INEHVEQGAWVWIFIGRIVKDKGMEELLQAWKKIHAAFPGDRLWLLGLEERALDPLSNEALEEMEKNPSIKRWGFIQDVRPYLAASEVLVFPSYREGFPNVPMQAGAMECALILSDINGCNEIVEHPVSGLLVPTKNEPALYEAMKAIRNNPAQRDALALAARKRIAEGFGQQQLWNTLLEEYNSCLKEKNL